MPAPVSAAVPKWLKPFKFQGVQLIHEEGEEQAHGDCPICGRDERFFVNVNSGLWDCKKCGKTGNPITFLRQFYETLDPDEKLDELAADRGIIYPQSLKDWGVRWSPLNDAFVFPGYGADGKLSQLYRYLRQPGGKYALLPTPELGHQLHRTTEWDPEKPVVYVFEGPWDGVAAYEVLKVSKTSENGLYLTGSVESSLYAQANVCAIPGCGSVGDPFKKWLPLFSDKIVVWFGDNDHPRCYCAACRQSWFLTESKKCPKCSKESTVQEPAAFAALKRAANIFSTAEEPPMEFQWLAWGSEGYDKDLDSGYDVRDKLTAVEGLPERVPLLGELFEKVQPIPDGWVVGGAKGGKKGQVELEPIECDSWAIVVNQWRKAMKWTEGLDRALSVMLASIVSTESVGDQLWVKILGPASCGKSTLCEAISIAKKYVLAKSTIRGFHSGFKSDSAGEEDNSLLDKLYNKTLVTKDGDTLLQSPNLPQILSEARDIYDRVSRTHYRNKMGKDYHGVNMTWVLCGTASLRSIDGSELGERFLDCVIMDGIDPDMEDEVLWRVANRVDRTLSLRSDGKGASQHDPELVKAMQLTGGYINYLRADAQSLLERVYTPEPMLRHCVHLGKFVAHLRARPSKMQSETAEREFAARLVSQHLRLAKCIAVVMNKQEVDGEVMRRTAACATDTARGLTMEIARVLFMNKEKGLPTDSIALMTNQTLDLTKSLLRFLSKIKAVEHRQEKTPGLAGKVKWFLSARMLKLYEEVIEVRHDNKPL